METRAPQGFVPVVAAVEPKPKRGSTATDLPKSKTVEPTEKLAATQLANDEAKREEAKARADAMRNESEMDIKTHAATGSLVIQTLDSSSGEVVHQFPDNATLKKRAIARYEALQGAPVIKRTV